MSRYRHRGRYSRRRGGHSGSNADGAEIVLLLIIGGFVLMVLLLVFGPGAVGVLALLSLPFVAAWVTKSLQSNPSPKLPPPADKQEEELPWIAEMRAQSAAKPPALPPRSEAKPSPMTRPVPPPKPAPPVAPHLTARQKQDRDDLRMREESRWLKEARDGRLAAPALKTVPAAEAELERKLQEIEQQIRRSSTR